MANGFVRGARAALTTLVLAIALCGCGERQAAYQPGPLPKADEWPANGRDTGQTRFSPLADINAQNVARLGFAWEFTGFETRGRTHHGMESNPILANGNLYVVGPWGSVYAVNAVTGAKVWAFEPELTHINGRLACCGVVNKGLAIADGKVFVGAFDGILYALDANTGSVVWKVDTFPTPRGNYSNSGAPFIAGDKVMIGNSGADMGARGYVSAYDIDTGRFAWRFWVVPGDPAAGPDESPDVTLARQTWPADARWELGLGGTAWDHMAYDPETNTAYIGTGNGGPHPAVLRSRSGAITDQLYLSSIVALDAATGRRKWHYQTTPGDSWDFGATSHMILANIEIDGRQRKVLMQAPKNGFFYMLDRETGELLRADKFSTANWASSVDLSTGRPVLTGYADYWLRPSFVYPSAAGGHAWQPMAFSPRTGLVYIPVYDSGMKERMREASNLPGSNNQGAEGFFPPFNEPGDQEELARQGIEARFEARLKAWNPLTGTVAWQSDLLPFVSGGVLVSGDLVFQGTTGGHLNAYDAATGRRLLHLFVGTNIMGAPITYKIDGVQYVAFTAGAGGPQGGVFQPDTAAAQYENYERLIVLKLDGGPTPLPPARVAPAQQPTPRRIAASAAVMQRGARIFENLCTRCHVRGGGVGIYPNLWNMAPETVEAFDSIVYGGALQGAGMSGFSDILTQADVAAIKAFIVNDTIEARRSGRQGGLQAGIRH
ncbi:MAG: PQQ-dependent dehydrogenase, methanol/ethanol family [Hyphomonadaceae bacterium]|nr:PQQ-dependent dehydrogenase, methanol/ethanol family [Hyphomonadaceae bacterium]